MENKYINGKIYCLRSHKTDNIYIGSTIQTLSKRLHKHKSEKYNELSKYDDVYIELIEEYPCNNKIELNKKEGEHIRANNCVNKNVAGRTKNEYYIDYKDELTETMKQYYIDNKYKIKERQKQYRIDNKDSISKQRKLSYLAKKESISCGS